jgi:hypothetical protein
MPTDKFYFWDVKHKMDLVSQKGTEGGLLLIVDQRSHRASLRSTAVDEIAWGDLELLPFYIEN